MCKCVCRWQTHTERHTNTLLLLLSRLLLSSHFLGPAHTVFFRVSTCTTNFANFALTHHWTSFSCQLLHHYHSKWTLRLFVLVYKLLERGEKCQSVFQMSPFARMSKIFSLLSQGRRWFTFKKPEFENAAFIFFCSSYFRLRPKRPDKHSHHTFTLKYLC